MLKQSRPCFEEADAAKDEAEPEPILVCKCLIDAESSEQIVVSPRKQKILSTVARTEEYLRVRRIPELIRFLITKVIADGSNRPIAFLENLLNEGMLFRAGHGLAPVLYEDRHLRAVIKSFDPGNRGWLTPGQVRRAFITLGLTLTETLNERIPTDVLFELLKTTQEKELFSLLTAGVCLEDDSRVDIELKNGGSTTD
ncbi:unnamed protein product [Arctia plantaginis]|uniref:Uncharacterized protein n=1 Tax=Arctia plantaginis TaxID=874455 RepID=A0A8S1A093_ARCPL|nr:unnamed protein product [Arctia plantaginis]